MRCVFCPLASCSNLAYVVDHFDDSFKLNSVVLHDLKLLVIAKVSQLGV